MTRPETVYVTWHFCDCDWTTKYCDEYHTHSAAIPIDVLEQYR